MPPHIDTEFIPEKIMIPILRHHQRVVGRIIEHFTESELESVRVDLGSEYAHVPLYDIGVIGGRLRRASKLGALKGHGPGKKPPSSEDIRKYECSHWDRVAHTKKLWNHHCAICNAHMPLSIHYRNFKDRPTECLPLCCHCYKKAQKRLEIQLARGEEVNVKGEFILP